MARFKGTKPGDVVFIETRSEEGYALAVAIAPDGVIYEPIGGAWNKTRFNRAPARAHEIKKVFRQLKV